MIGSSYMSRMYFQFSVQYGYSFRIKTVHESCGTCYESWKEEVKATRSKLKGECSDQDLSDLMDSIEGMESQVKNVL